MFYSYIYLHCIYCTLYWYCLHLQLKTWQCCEMPAKMRSLHTFISCKYDFSQIRFDMCFGRFDKLSSALPEQLCRHREKATKMSTSIPNKKIQVSKTCFRSIWIREISFCKSNANQMGDKVLDFMCLVEPVFRNERCVLSSCDSPNDSLLPRSPLYARVGFASSSNFLSLLASMRISFPDTSRADLWRSIWDMAEKASEKGEKKEKPK